MNSHVTKTESGSPEIEPIPDDHESKASYVVGLGASAGGLEALVDFFDAMPADSGMAFVVVQHLSPDYKSLMDELLGRHTTMQIVKVSDGQALGPNRIYLPPPKKNLTLFNGQLLLTSPDRHIALNLPIDFFFRSLAEDQENRAIGVVLSGTGSDGTRGIQAIKKAGGMVMVQDENSAKFDGMPKSAISTGLVDYVVSPRQMPEIILGYANHPLIVRGHKADPNFSIHQTGMTKLVAMLRTQTGVDFSYYKQPTVQRRIERRLGINQVSDLEQYLKFISDHPEEIDALYRDLLIGVTKFFRDKDEFDYLRKQVVPSIFERNQQEKVIRAWVVGCSTGEEAFTLAMLLYDHMKNARQYYEIKVFATDIDKDAITRGSQGVYPDGIAADLDPLFLEKYFGKCPEGFRVKRHIRELVIFARQNILKDPPFTKIDLITCRNLLIYLQTRLQKEVLDLFHFALKDNGYLFLGTSESVGDACDHFISADRSVKVFVHKGQGIPPVRRIHTPIRTEKTQISLPDFTSDAFLGSSVRKVDQVERYYQQIIDHLAECCVIVNEQGNLLETFGKPEQFLSAQLGKVDLKIGRMVPPNAALALSTGMRNAIKDRKPVAFTNVRIGEDARPRGIDVKIVPLKSVARDSDQLLILFETAHEGPKESQDETTIALDARANQQMIDLQNEIQLTRESLQAANEELQTSNEELQATNEELLASNEELQSTNEELNSVNEELNTVNAEYQAKIAELLELNTDMDNLLRSTEVGTIFLDKSLRIRKFTPAVTRELNLLEPDIGRPFSDLSLPLLADIHRDIRHTLLTAEICEKVVRSRNDRWYLLQILPYRNEQGDIAGIIISMVNISKQKKAEIAIQKNRDMLQQILETSPAAQLMTDSQNNLIFANLQAQTMLGITPDQMAGMRFDASCLKLTDLDGNLITLDNGPLARVLTTRTALAKFVICLERNDGSVIFNLSGNPFFNDVGEVDGVVFKLDKLAEASVDHSSHTEEETA